jgi:uncharacterized protein
MNFLSGRNVFFFMCFIVLLFFFSSARIHAQSTPPTPQFNVLIFTKTVEYHHQSINEAIDGFRELSKKHNFTLDWQEDASVFTDEYLKKFHVIIFMLTTGDILNSAQQEAMERFVRSGKGFVGIHSASDTESAWPWYLQLVGRQFHIHPEVMTAELSVINRKFPGFAQMPDRLLWTDEWYEFGPEQVKGLNYLLAVDEQTYSPDANWGHKQGKGMGKFHPIAWYHEFDGGRSFYTSLGHTPAIYANTVFMEHVYGGIYWAATAKGLRK